MTGRLQTFGRRAHGKDESEFRSFFDKIIQLAFRVPTARSLILRQPSRLLGLLPAIRGFSRTLANFFFSGFQTVESSFDHSRSAAG